jgi:hypothetical protein
MVPTHYKLLFRGRALDGYEPGAVRHKLGVVLKLDDGGLEQLFSGRLITLKRGLEQAEAGKYQALLEQLGAEILLQPDAEAEQQQDDGGEKNHSPGDAVVEQAEVTVEGELDCPRCGHRQPIADECAHCKMDLRLHIKRMRRKAKVQLLRSKRVANG